MGFHWKHIWIWTFNFELAGFHQKDRGKNRFSPAIIFRIFSHCLQWCLMGFFEGEVSKFIGGIGFYCSPRFAKTNQRQPFPALTSHSDGLIMRSDRLRCGPCMQSLLSITGERNVVLVSSTRHKWCKNHLRKVWNGYGRYRMKPNSDIIKEITNPLEKTRVGNMELAPLGIELNHLDATDDV